MMGLAVNILYVVIYTDTEVKSYVFIFIVYFNVHLLVSKIDVHKIADMQT